MKSDKFKKAISGFNRVTVEFIFANFLLLILALSSVAQAGNFTVNNVSQFQTALNTAAANGENDTIDVLAGTYNVNPTLTYSSTENYFILIRGVGSPVLEGGNARRIIQLTSTANNGNIYLVGLTIQHGQADYGGGVQVVTQSADISLNNCTINDNTAGFVGGGANLGSNTGNITITNCTFRRNSSPNTSGYPYGTAGGLFAQTDGVGTIIKMTGCTSEQNTAERDGAGAMLYPLGGNSTVIAESNTFNNNTAKEFGGGCWIRGPGGNTTVRYRNNTLTGNSSSVAGSGGGTYIQITLGTINLFDNIHIGNNAMWQGGGLWIEHGGGTLNVHHNRFTGNTSNQTGGGANVFLDNGTAKVNHNVFFENGSTDAGGGLNLSTTTGSVHIYNNTFYFNTSTDGGDVYFYFDNASSTSNFYNNILYNSSAPALSYSGQQTVVARYSDIQGGVGQPWFGIGCIDVYPLFVDTAGGDFHLQDSINCSDLRYSSCIDAGDPAVQDSILNCDLGLGAFRSDMGAYGGRAIPIGIKKLSTNIPEKYHLSQNYPNPFNPFTTIKFDIPKSSNIKIIIYDILGKEIVELVNEKLSAGTYSVDWLTANLPSGVYFYKLITDSYVDTKKMVLLK
ncbi:T9SS type A sorting domain-containing protein [Bacteroidota bacterium]